jgi:hypothetical protein
VCPDRSNPHHFVLTSPPNTPTLQYSINPTNASSLGEISGLVLSEIEDTGALFAEGDLVVGLDVELGYLDDIHVATATFPVVERDDGNVAFTGEAMNVIYTVGSTGPTQLSTGVLMRIELPGVTGATILPPAR